jgi:two-component system KDP operon response regulator KdpE
MESNKVRILVADDERPIRRFLSACLGDQYTVLEAATGEEVLSVAASGHPDLIILDLGFPDLDGVEVVRRLREWMQTPIIVISVRDQEQDKIAALDAGADDYLTKPFGAGELLARLRANLRRGMHPESDPLFQVADLSVDLVCRKVQVNGRSVPLTPTEYDILRILVQNAGKVITHQQLVHAVWGSDCEADMHLLRVNISNLRRKIETDPIHPRNLQTIPGVGYQLKAG